MSNPYQPPDSNLDSHETYGAGVATVSPRILQIMARTRGWVRLCGILFFIFAALSFASVFVVGSASADVGVDFVAGLISALFYIFPAIKLNAYASRITRLLTSNQAGDLQQALNQHRGFWKYVGIISILILLVIAVVIFSAVAGNIARH
jgi:hypothetical protein